MNKCGIVKDLLTIYVSGLGSDESRALVEEHIRTCGDCSDKLAELQNRVVLQLQANDTAKVNVLKTMKKRIFRRNVFVAIVSSVIVCLAAVAVGAKVMHAVPIEYYDGLVKAQVNYAYYYINDDDISVVITDPQNSTPTDNILAVLDMICSQSYYSTQATGRTIVRDGENVRVEYICYTENILSKMNSNIKQQSQIFRLFHYDKVNDNIDRVEVYYLTDPEVANKMNDKDYDDYRKTGDLVWSGTLE